MKNPVIKAGYDVNESWQKGNARMHDRQDLKYTN